jgi:hypothetical protein
MPMLPDGPHTVCLRARSPADALEDPPFCLSWTIQSHSRDWRLQHFGSTANTGNGLDENDPDFDGISNILERALGLSPHVGETLPLSLVDQPDGTWAVEYVRSIKAKAETHFQVQWSDSLASGAWSSQGVTETVTPLASATETVRATIPASPRRRFARVQVIAKPE